MSPGQTVPYSAPAGIPPQEPQSSWPACPRRPPAGPPAVLIYENPLASPGDHAGFVLEGQAAISVHEGTTRLASVVDELARQAANYVWWCPQELPADFDAEWDFWPEAERGLCILFFAARGRGGEDL